MIDELTSIVINASNVDYCEARFHKRSEQKISISKGEFEDGKYLDISLRVDKNSKKRS